MLSIHISWYVPLNHFLPCLCNDNENQCYSGENIYAWFIVVLVREGSLKNWLGPGKVLEKSRNFIIRKAWEPCYITTVPDLPWLKKSLLVMSNVSDAAEPHASCVVVYFWVFYPRPVLAFGYCRCLRLSVCVSVRVCSKHLIVLQG